MRKKAGIISILLGVVLMGSALLLFLHNREEDQKAEQQARQALGNIKIEIAQHGGKLQQSMGENNSEDQSEDEQSRDMKVMNVDGYDYIGYLIIEDLQLELPVMAKWDYERLKIAPCRQSGATYTNDLVIAAHNYSSHFGRLTELEEGSTICFTDMDGNQIVYRLVKLDTLQSNEVDKVIGSEYDLVLYTCTFGGSSRVSAFCERIEKQTEDG